MKTGYEHDSDVFVSKIAGGGAAGHGNTGLLLVFSQRTMRLQTVLLDEGLLTEVRTAAATCAVSRLLAPKTITKIGLFGVGIQAVWQLRFLRLITNCRTVLVKSRSRSSAEKFKETLATSSSPLDREWEVQIAEDNTQFRECQLIHTLTAARQPVLTAADLGLDCEEPGSSSKFFPHGLHISAVGADSPGKQELDVPLLRSAALLVCDSLAQTFERGEFQGLAKFVGEEKARQLVREVGSLFENPEITSSPRLTIFDTSGIALQDVFIAKLASRAVLGE